MLKCFKHFSRHCRYSTKPNIQTVSLLTLIYITIGHEKQQKQMYIPEKTSSKVKKHVAC